MSQFEEDEELVEEPPRRPFRPDLILPVLLKPRKTLREIVNLEGANWLAPLLLLSLVAILVVVVSAPLRVQALQAKPVELPPDAQFWDSMMIEEFMKNNQPNVGFLAIYGLPALTQVIGVWLGWLILSALLHLSLTLTGGRGKSSGDTNLAAWGSLPFAVRGVVQIVFMLLTRQVVQGPGLSGLVSAEGTGLALFASLMLGFVDIYFIWHFVLLVLGASGPDRLPLGKAVWVVAISLLILVSLSAIPGFIGARLSGLTVTRMF